jgi:uncharacterized protein (TIGR02145 family)
MNIFKFFQKSKKSQSNLQNFFVDQRDSEKYHYIQIGDKLWMTENFRFNRNEYKQGYSWNYNSNDYKINEYGCLYAWNPAKNWAPEGWRLPTKNDYYSMISLLTKNGGNGFDMIVKGGSSGFNGVFGGMYNELYSPDKIGETGFYWTSEKKYEWSSDDDHYYLCLIGRERKYGFDTMYSSQLLSVRYIKDLIG